MKRITKNLLTGGIVLTLMLFAQLLSAQEEIQLKSAYEIRINANGSSTVVPLKIENSLPPAARSFDSATLIRPTRWTPGVKFVKFNSTEYASDYLKKIKKAANKYHNTKRGNGSVPRIKTLSTEVKVKDISTFSNPWEFYQQFAFDDQNSVVMTEDDQFFKSPNGILFNLNLVAVTRVYSSAQFKLKSGKWVGVYYIEDTDIELRSDFFEMPSDQQNMILAAAFKFAMGYEQSAWTHDILGENNPFVDIAALKDKNSDVWQKMMHQWDNFYYQDRLVGPTAAFHSVPQVLPFDQEVIDLADYETPPTDENIQEPTGVSQALFVTNLKGYTGTKKLNITFTQVTLENNKEKKKNILSISGNAYDYPVDVQGTKVYPTLWFNKVILGNEGDLNKLRNAIKNDGTPQTMFARNFSKLLRIDVQFKGRLEEGGAVKSKTMTYYFTDSSIN